MSLAAVILASSSVFSLGSAGASTLFCGGDIDICLAEGYPIFVCYDFQPNHGEDCSNHKIISFSR